MQIQHIVTYNNFPLKVDHIGAREIACCSKAPEHTFSSLELMKSRKSGVGKAHL